MCWWYNELYNEWYSWKFVDDTMNIWYSWKFVDDMMNDIIWYSWECVDDIMNYTMNDIVGNLLMIQWTYGIVGNCWWYDEWYNMI